MAKLSADTRERIVHFLSLRCSSSMENYDSSDWYDIARNGYVAIADATDSLLLDYLKEVVLVDEELQEDKLDAQLNALYSLKNVITDPEDIKLVEKRIQERELELDSASNPVEREPTESRVLLDRAEAELAVENMLTRED